MKKIIKKIIPHFVFERLKRLLNLIKLNKNYFNEMRRYSKYSFELTKNKTQRHLESNLIFFYHKIEKGLSLPNPRVGFGEKKVYHLLELVKVYYNRFGWDKTAQVSLNTLFAYYKFNKDHNLDLKDLYIELEELKKISTNNTTVGGVTNINLKDIESARINFKDFANSRYSLRAFLPGEIPLSKIRESVEIAQKTPSVCNRQSCKVYVFDKYRKDAILKHQNGNSGFGKDADKVLIITANLKDFRGPKERNQAYIDGGLFSMSIIYALHSLNVGTCALNLSLDYRDEEKLKEDAKIPKSEVALMMVALGNFPESFYVTDSPRRNTKDVLKVIDGSSS
ncbi:nitroreductase family protein [Oceanobacillus massiliensis]|uniref:nitroreductase family protein n=1 Tax=Oceanobacillus massiliensis TaxID=1465765 RepID=UPI0002889F70|nr:nitroreductase family protein [Oceanobacillus massiliensis]